MTDNPPSSQPSAPGPGEIVAVLRTGIMGSAMARNLAVAGLPTRAWDRSAEAAAPHPGLVRKLAVVSAPCRRDGWFPEVLAGFDHQLAPAAARNASASSAGRVNSDSWLPGVVIGVAPIRCAKRSQPYSPSGSETSSADST